MLTDTDRSPQPMQALPIKLLPSLYTVPLTLDSFEVKLLSHHANANLKILFHVMINILILDHGIPCVRRAELQILIFVIQQRGTFKVKIKVFN